MTEMLKNVVLMSNKYGSDPEYVLAGGGNTSCKDEGTLFVKGSGTSLATITEEGFVGMSRAKLQEIFTKAYSEDDDAREAEVLADMMAAKLPGNEAKRPSVEAALHHIISHKYVLHVHPAFVNGLTCGAEGEERAKQMFNGEAIWVPICKPGYTLAILCRDALNKFKEEHGKECSVLLLQNHGIFFGAADLNEMDALVARVAAAFATAEIREPNMDAVSFDEQKAEDLQAAVAAALDTDAANTQFVVNKDIAAYTASKRAFAAIERPFTPDHIVYCKANFLYITGEDIAAQVKAFKEANGYAPKVFIAEGLGAVCAGNSAKDLANVVALFKDAVKIAAYAENFGGALPMTPELVDFIVNWEIESYRAKAAQ